MLHGACRYLTPPTSSTCMWACRLGMTFWRSCLVAVFTILLLCIFSSEVLEFGVFYCFMEGVGRLWCGWLLRGKQSVDHVCLSRNLVHGLRSGMKIQGRKSKIRKSTY